VTWHGVLSTRPSGLLKTGTAVPIGPVDQAREGGGGEMTEREDAQLCAEEEGSVEEPAADAVEEPIADIPPRGTCRSNLRGWAGAHLHGAVRPRRRAAGRGRPPGRWC
jgi:hypothetical protein